ncbi:uncharacterized protein LOC135492023 [Lineus longissimus]|uniref:uncharacterized protein LOC135492023 n=1 Tax=Lineus longissimus TaxID=88925 RepID=UPI002B4D6973
MDELSFCDRLLGKKSFLEKAREVSANVAEESRYEGLKIDYDFENLVFEGGGAKGIAYAGAIKALEDLGIMKKIKRVAGASVGAFSAMLVAIGASVDELIVQGLIDIKYLTNDAGGLFNVIMNLFKRFGMNPGNRLLDHIRKMLEKYTGNPNITFEELYKLRGVELCVVVSNLSISSIEYCHMKTTPDLPIALAVKISMSLPFLFEPNKIPVGFTRGLNENELYVDGGVLSNYPVRAFDGWFLSLDVEQSFFHMVGSDVPMFEGENKKTLGLKIFDARENDADELIYMRRYGEEKQKRPRTALSKKNGKKVDKVLKAKTLKLRMAEAATKFLTFLKKCDTDGSGTISLEEFKAGLRRIGVGDKEKEEQESACSSGESSSAKDGEFSLADWHLLFESESLKAGMDVDEIFSEIDKDSDKEITFTEIVSYMSKKGVALRRIMIKARGAHRPDLKSLPDFISAFTDTYAITLTQLNSLPNENERTIGVFTDYVGTLDFEQELADSRYVIKQGWLAAVSFLKERNAKK